MISTSLLIQVAIIEACVLAVTILLFFGRGATLDLRTRRGLAPLARGRVLMAKVMDVGLASAEIDELASMEWDVQLQLFSELTPMLTGADRLALADLADRVGVTARAEQECRSPKWHRRLRAVRVLTTVGADSQAARELLDDTNTEVAAQAAQWAAEHPSPEVVDKLAKMLGDDRSLCRFTVQDSLLRLGSMSVPSVARLLAEGTEGSIPALRVAAKIGDARFLSGAMRSSTNVLPQVRAEAAALLGALGGGEPARRLIEMLEDPDEIPRAAAARALGRMGQWPSAPELAQKLTDPSWEVRRAAGLALSSLGAPGILILRRALRSSDAFAADMARHILDVNEEHPQEAI
jgi:HEAT repeat protein